MAEVTDSDIEAADELLNLQHDEFDELQALREQFMNVLHAMLGYMQIALKCIILFHNIKFCLITH